MECLTPFRLSLLPTTSGGFAMTKLDVDEKLIYANYKGKGNKTL